MLAYASFIAVAMSTLWLGVWALLIVSDETPYFGIELNGIGGHVTFLDPGGPAIGAGVMLNDRITGFDGRRLFTDPSLVRGRGADDTVLIEIRRDGNLFTVPLELARFTTRETRFSLQRIFIGGMFWLIGLVVWACRTGNRVTRLFFMFSQGIAAMLFLDVLDPFVPLAIIGSDTLMMALGPFVIHFYATFPHPLESTHRRFILAAAYLAFGTLAILGITLPLLSPAIADSITLWRLQGVFTVAMLLIGVFLLLRPAARGSIAVRRRRRVLIAGMLIGVAPVLFITLIPHSLRGVPVLYHEFTVPFMALVPVTYAYAFYKGELGHTDFLLNRTLVYVLLTGALLLLYTFLILALGSVMVADQKKIYITATTILLVAAGLIFVPLRDWLQKGVDHLFYGGWYDYRSVVRQMSEQFSRITDLDHMVDQLLSAATTMRFQKAAVYFRTGAGLQLLRSSSPGSEWPEDPESVREQLLQGNGPVVRRTQPATDHDQVWAQDGENDEIWVEMANDGVLRAVLVMADRTGNEGLDSEDMDIIQTMSRQAAVACANLHLLEDLRTRLREVESTRDALEAARRRLNEVREAERLHLARELHDGPVQDFYAVGHGLDSLITLPEADGDGVARLRSMVDDGAARLREICMQLRPPLLADAGLEAALRLFLSAYHEKYPHLEVELAAVTISERPGPDVELALFRVCQEALTNARQHGSASHVVVSYFFDGLRCLLTIEDDGCGFRRPRHWTDFARSGRIGVLGMAERIEAVGGTFDIVSFPGEGSTVRVTIPIQHTSPS
jgi:signal transduction histidine kinase